MSLLSQPQVKVGVQVKVCAKDGPHPAPHLEHGDVVFPVNLVGRRVEPAALLHVLVEDAATLHVAKAELAQVELWQSGGRQQRRKMSSLNPD